MSAEALRLLDLTVEYRNAVDARDLGYDNAGGRAPEEIADEYATALRAVLTPQ